MDTRTEEEKRGFFALLRATDLPALAITLALTMSIVTTIIGLAVPLVTKTFIDQFSLATLSKIQIGILVIVLLLRAVSGGISTYLLNKIGNTVVASIRDRLWKKLIALPVSFFDQHQTGETVSRMTNDTAVIKSLASEHLTNFVSGVITIIGSLIFLFVLDWKLSLVTLIVVPAIVLIIIPIGRKMHKISKATQDESARFSGMLSNVLMEIRLVKISNAENNEYENGKQGIQNLLQLGIREGLYTALLSPIVSLLLMALLVGIIGYGGIRVSSGALSAGALVAYLLYLFQLIMPMTQFALFFTEWQKAKGATERILTLLHTEEEHYQIGADLQRIQEPIHIENLHFGYGEEKIIRGIDFTIPPGKVTAIVGPSGSGKTTLFSLLERYYEPQQGTITLGPTPIAAYNLSTWRKSIGYVTQESPLISGTIRDNICYGLTAVTEEQLNLAIQMAYADQFIDTLPDGLQTEVGERGIKLSGGQRQRIGIARALLRNPSLLLLDEATSSLDSKSEIVVQQALQNLMADRTTVIIAHRLATVVDANQIIFLDKGVITGVGTHEELYHSHELYREFAAQQLQKGLGQKDVN